MNWLGVITLELCYQEHSSPENFFNALEREGWSFSVDGEVTYLLDNKDGLYDFIYADENEWPVIKKELIRYLNDGKEVHVTMKFGDELASWIVQIEAGFEKVVFSVEQYKKRIEGTDVTDFSWHLSYIIPAFVKTGYSIKSVVCDHFGG